MDDALLTSLLDLRMAMMAAANKDTAHNPDKWETGNVALAGHCAAVAHVVREKFGGDIVVGRVNDETHYWNRLQDGTEVDLTSDQYGGDGINPVTTGRKTQERRTVNPRFIKFQRRVERYLKP